MSNPDENRTPAIRVDGRRLLRGILLFCLIAEILFVILDALVSYPDWLHYGMIRRFFNIAREDSLSSWFGVIQTWMVGLTLGLLWLVSRRDGRPRFVQIGWLVLAIFFLCMSADDGAEFHERAGSAFKKSRPVAFESPAEKPVPDAYPSYAWQVVCLPFFGAMGLFMMIFLWKELRGRKERLLVLSAVLLLSAGVVLDFFEGLDEFHPWNIHTKIAEGVGEDADWPRSPYSTSRHFSKSAEEFMEMLAATLLWVAFLSHLMKTSQSIHIEFRAIGEASG